MRSIDSAECKHGHSLFHPAPCPLCEAEPFAEVSPRQSLYYEAHVTVEPIFDGPQLTLFTSLCKARQFLPAKLLMQRRATDTPERSSKDSFCTGRGTDRADLTDRMVELIQSLRVNGFKVWRYKIEDTLLDSRHSDVLGLLG